MKNKSFFMKVFIATAACFLLAYISALIGGFGKDFPNILLVKFSGEEKGIPFKIERKIEDQTINAVAMDFSSSNIKIIPSESNSIEILFKGKSTIKEPEKILFQEIKDGKLILRPGGYKRLTDIKVSDEEKEKTGKLSLIIDSAKSEILRSEIILKLPKRIKSLEVNNISGELLEKNIELDSLKIQTISSDIKLVEMHLKNADISTVSGDIYFDSNISNQLKATSTSGDLIFKINNDKPKLEITTTSGDTSIQFKNKPDLQFNYNSVSGELKLQDQKKEDKKTSTYSQTFGKGTGKITVNSVSGDLKLNIN